MDIKRGYPEVKISIILAPLIGFLTLGKNHKKTDLLGEFTLRERKRMETGSPLGEWILVDHLPVFFQSRDGLVEKIYRSQAQDILL